MQYVFFTFHTPYLKDLFLISISIHWACPLILEARCPQGFDFKGGNVVGSSWMSTIQKDITIKSCAKTCNKNGKCTAIEYRPSKSWTCRLLRTPEIDSDQIEDQIICLGGTLIFTLFNSCLYISVENNCSVKSLIVELILTLFTILN